LLRNRPSRPLAGPARHLLLRPMTPDRPRGTTPMTTDRLRDSTPMTTDRLRDHGP
jgi:hypothetical protein